MGTWNSSLFSNDTTLDVKDTYIQQLKQQKSNEDAYQNTYNEFKELIGTEEEPLFWYAIAEIQWQVGRLTSDVKKRALHFIQNEGGLSLWDQNYSGFIKWKETLKKLEATLQSPMPSEKKFFRMTKFKQNPWDIGDVYAYQLHTEKSKECGLFGKYMLMQKIGNVEYFESVNYSAIQVFNSVFDFIPNLNIIERLEILPLIFSPGTNGCPNDINSYVPSIEWYMKATMLYEKKSDYPKEHLTFIGNVDLPKIKYCGNNFTDFYWQKNGMEEWLIDYFLSWKAKQDSR